MRKSSVRSLHRQSVNSKVVIHDPLHRLRNVESIIVKRDLYSVPDISPEFLLHFTLLSSTDLFVRLKRRCHSLFVCQPEFWLESPKLLSMC